MKLSHTLLICACLVFAGMNFSNAVTPAPAPQQQVQKWEYLYIKVESWGSNVDRTASYGDGEPAPYTSPGSLGRAGDDGWELVQVFIDRYQKGIGSAREIAVSANYHFKRPKN